MSGHTEGEDAQGPLAAGAQQLGAIEALGEAGLETGLDRGIDLAEDGLEVFDLGDDLAVRRRRLTVDLQVGLDQRTEAQRHSRQDAYPLPCQYQW